MTTPPRTEPSVLPPEPVAEMDWLRGYCHDQYSKTIVTYIDSLQSVARLAIEDTRRMDWTEQCQSIFFFMEEMDDKYPDMEDKTFREQIDAAMAIDAARRKPE